MNEIQAYIIDVNGFIIGSVMVKEGDILDENTIPKGWDILLFMPKWDRSTLAWVEGLDPVEAQKRLDEINNAPTPPSP